MAHEVPALGYSFDALEPHIDAKTMEIHHDRHHATYVAGLNAALESHADLQGKSLEDLIGDLDALPGGIQTAVRNSGGGHWNHSFFWKIMGQGGGEPGGALLDAIMAGFGTLDEMKSQFSAAAVGRFGSGWACLVKKSDGSVGLASTIGAGNPMTAGDKPLLTCDVWEHAYYIDYRNARPKFVEAFWNVVNWDFVAKNFA